MGRQANLESPTQPQDAATRVDCISGNCCDPRMFPARWDMGCIRCIFCPDDADKLTDAQSVRVLGFDSITFHDFRFQNGEWVHEDWSAGGYQRDGEIAMLNDESCDSAANTLYHEVRHLNQADGMSTYDAEYDAFFATEDWTIQKGLKDLRGLRRTDEHGNEVPNPDAIDALVRREYLGAPTEGDVPTEQAVGFEIDPPQTYWENHVTGEITLRPSQEGEYVQGTEFTVEGERTIPKSELTCDG